MAGPRQMMGQSSFIIITKTGYIIEAYKNAQG